MVFFKLFLPTTALLLSILSLGVCYWIVTRAREGQFIPIYYFLALSLISVILMSGSRLSEILLPGSILSKILVQDLMVAWISLFLFGALWQSYETSVCVLPKKLQD